MAKIRAGGNSALLHFNLLGDKMRKIIFPILILCLITFPCLAQNIYNGNISIADSASMDQFITVAAANTGFEYRFFIDKAFSYMKNYTVGANVTIVFTGDGYITNTGYTATVNGAIEGPNVQFTDGTVTYSATSLGNYNPVWAGGKRGTEISITESGNAVADHRYFDHLVTMSADPAGSAEVTGFRSRLDKSGGSNGVYTLNGFEGVAGSSYADEAGTFRGVYGRTYTSAGTTASMRTAIGGEFSARASYAGGTACVAENGTAFVGTRIWMAPYFSSGSVGNINNFWGLWIYGEHASQRNADAAIKISDAGGGFTDDIIMQSGAAIRNDHADSLKITEANVKVIGDMIVDGAADGLGFTGAYTDAALDFTNVTLNHGGSSGPVMMRAGTYGSPVSSSDAGQSGMIRLYGANSATTDDESSGFYDRIIFANQQITGNKGGITVAGLVEVRNVGAEAGPTNIKGAEFIVGLHTSTAKLAASGEMYAQWLKVYSISGSVAAATSKVAPAWIDNQMSGTVSGEEYGIFATTGGTRPDGFIGFETTSSGYDQFLYFDATFNSGAGTMVTTDAVPGGNQDARIKVYYNGTQYYIPLYR
jgi:hypothetical protein